MMRASAQGSESQRRRDADKYAGGDTAEHKYRKIKEYAKVLDEGRGNKELAQVVQNACGHADTGH